MGNLFFEHSLSSKGRPHRPNFKEDTRNAPFCIAFFYKKGVYTKIHVKKMIYLELSYDVAHQSG